MSTSILLVDDNQLIVELLMEFLDETPYQITVCNDGAEAWQLLEQQPAKFSAVLLDRRMPKMGGMEVLKRVRSHTEMAHLPVILQTSADSESDILEGIQAGASYYLTKPFDKKTLLTILDVAITDYQHYLQLKSEIKRTETSLSLMRSGEFAFRNMEDGKNIAILLSSICPDPQTAAMGLSELIINAIEHGNLGITYDQKSKLLLEGNWENEINHRLSLPDYAARYVSITFKKTSHTTEIVIKDQGDGFDWSKYLQFDPSRAFDPNGRGIAMANNMQSARIQYMGKGNEVKVTLEFCS